MKREKIHNRKELEVNELRKRALAIAEAGLDAIDTREAIRRSVRLEGGTLYIENRSFSLANARRLHVVGIGKCSFEAAKELEALLGDAIESGVVVDVKGEDLEKIRVFTGDHPLPSERNITATRAIIEMLDALAEDDLVICIVSGGGSALLCQPENHTCRDEAAITKCLFEAGANIQEINTIRKHLSRARGGHLAKFAYPAQVISLIFSDVPGDDIQFIASGPTVRDATTAADAKRVIERYDVKGKCGFREEGLIETPKEDKYFKRVTNMILVSNKTALAAMTEAARNSGFTARICEYCLSGEARVVGENMARAIGKEEPGAALLYGGETTVTVKGKGEGGRNQELALGALRGIREGELVLALASDGIDNTSAAGAIADAETLRRAQAADLDPDKYLDDNNSYEFFQKTQSAIITGHTGSNVADLVLTLKAAPV